MHVAVVGAGIGGLVAAAGLQRSGVDVSVLEADAAPRQSGSGLSVFGNGWTALDAVGVGEEVAARAGDAVTGLTAGQRRPDGRWLATTSSAAIAQLRIVHRQDLHDVLCTALAPGTITYGARATGVSEDGRTVLVEGRTASVNRFDVVVAADGIRSRIRGAWPADVGVRYSGYATWRGVTSAAVDLQGAAGETWGRGLRFGCAPLADGRVYWFAVATMPKDSVVDDEHARVQELFGDWHDPISELIAATEPDVVFRLPIEELAGPMPTFRRGRTVLLGDAAHAMTPDLGQGGNQAMEDGATLAALLRPFAGVRDPDPGAVDRALTEYDALRRARTQPIARRARLVGRVAQAGGAWSSYVRDLALRAMPARATDAQLVEMQAWQPPPLS